MGAKSHKELAAWQLADKLRHEVYALIRSGPAKTDLRFRSQAEDAASSTCRNLSEGFARFNPGEFAHYARYAEASNAEPGDLLEDGVAREYWTMERVSRAQRLQERTKKAVGRLQRYLRSAQARRNAAEILNRDGNGRRRRA